MKKNTQSKILELIKNGEANMPFSIASQLEISRQMTQRHLKKLLSENLIEKIGTPPKVFYKIKTKESENNVVLEKNLSKVLDEHFYYISPRGKELNGTQGFIVWCDDRKFDTQKKAQEFSIITKKYQKLKRDGLYDATSKLKNTFANGADELYYYDFYAIEVFGKTKTGQKLLYAKQSENKKLIKELALTIKPVIEKLIETKNIDAIGYVQPTVPRQIQFMKILERELNLSLPKISIVKIISDIRVPQKTLKKLSDRIENANETFVVERGTHYNKVLLIDDAVGSGASINQIALKLKDKGLTNKVIGFAITGSLNDFDVISEV